MSANPAAKTASASADDVGGPAAAFGLAAAITIVFNTVLAWVKDAYEPLNSVMASLTGHHWRTHGLVDVVVFFALGYFFMSRKLRIDGVRLAAVLAVAVVVAGGGLALWFVLV
jgi:hypothetical protein